MPGLSQVVRVLALLTICLASLAPLSPAASKDPVPRVPSYDHIVLVMMENKDYKHIIGNTAEAPYINELVTRGALMTNYQALVHPSLPNYYALYAGTTFGVIDDEDYVLHGPTLASILHKAGKTFIGYVEHPNSTDSHNPWASFPADEDVEQDFKTFPYGRYKDLPTVSFVIPNVDNDMHDGTIAQGDTWLKTHLDDYAKWAMTNNSLLIVLWDETDEGSPNHVPCILVGEHVKPGKYGKLVNNYNVLSTLLAAHELVGPQNAAKAPILDVFGLRGPEPVRKSSPERGPRTPRVVRTILP